MFSFLLYTNNKLVEICTQKITSLDNILWKTKLLIFEFHPTGKAF